MRNMCGNWARTVRPIGTWPADITLKQMLTSWYMLLIFRSHLPEWVIGRNNFTTLADVFRKTTTENPASPTKTLKCTTGIVRASQAR